MGGIVNKGEYWCLGKVLYILKKFLPKELSEIYLNSIKYKLNLKKQLLILDSIKFPARALKPDSIKHSVKGPAADRLGYQITEMTELYHTLKNQHMLIRNLADFKLLILPLFYLVHGEAYDSEDPLSMSSYFAQVTKS